MAISVVRAEAVDGNVVRVQFSEPYNQNAALYTASNFVFRVRFGPIVDIYAKSIEVYSPTHVTVTLRDAMLKGGHYELSVVGVSAISDDVPIEQGSGVRTAVFDGWESSDGYKVFDVRKRVPSWWETRWGSVLHALLGATGSQLETTGGQTAESELNQVARALVIRTAEGKDLSIIGQNFGVSRPDFVANDDVMYRKLLTIFGTRKKSILSIFHEALTAALGESETTGWGLYEITANNIEIVLPANLFFGLAPGTLESATYFHADRTVVSPPSYMGDYFLEDASIEGSTIGGHIIIIFQQTIIDDIVTPLKAAGIQINIHVLGG